VSGARDNQLLKGVSRSFYLSLRLLPRRMRGAASLGYLLARTSDTLADASAAPAEARLASLDAFSRALAGAGPQLHWEPGVFNGIADPRERILLGNTDSLFAWLEHLPEAESSLVREVVGTIIGGQKLDIERFGAACGEDPACLSDDAELEDYIWRVAGCVGAFWTKLGFLTLGGHFSQNDPQQLITRGIDYGKGLQLVNILRDTAADLAEGRCYLPLPDPRDTTRLMSEHGRWLDRAMDYVKEGFEYAKALESLRLRAASVLPAMLAGKTLELLKNAGPDMLRKRIKVPRSYVYLALMRAFIHR
jgi:farnesyl-diphosphate farnesyltransferase